MLNDEASSREDFETAEATLATTRPNCFRSMRWCRRRLKSTRKRSTGYTRIVAPMDGIVIAVVTQQGQTVNSTQSAPTIVKLARLDMMTIKAQISEADITRISPGQRLTTIFSDRINADATLRTIELAPESVMKDDSLAGTSSAGLRHLERVGLLQRAAGRAQPGKRLRIAMTAQGFLAARRSALLVPIRGGA